MANEQNLVPFNERTKSEQREITRKGGIASGKSRREAKRRGEIWRELVNTEVTNEKMLANLRALGVTDEHPTFEQYIKATAMKDMMKNAKMQDVQRLDDELYGLQTQKVESTVIAPKPLVDLTGRSKNGS